MEELKFELQFEHPCPNVIKFYFSQKNQLYFIITKEKNHNKKKYIINQNIIPKHLNL